MIDHRRKYIFIHIPKTGGSSISKMLPKGGIVFNDERNRKSIYEKHNSIQQIAETFGDTIPHYFKFAFIRNPYTWLLSNYFYNRGLHYPFVKNTEFYVTVEIPEKLKKISFADWVVWWTEKFNPSQFITDANNKILVDRIYHFESLRSDYLKICQYMRWVPKLQFPLIHKRNNAFLSRHLNDRELKSYIKKRYAEDFKIGGYDY